MHGTQNATDILAANATPSLPPPSSNEAYEILVSAVFTVIIVGGLIGNALVIFTVLRWKDMQTPCNYLIMNIAIADLAVAVVAAPLRILELFLGWPFGLFMCHFLAPLQDLFVCVSVVSHTAIALERYRAILKPMKPHISLQKTRLAITSSWIFCFLTGSLPVALMVGLTQYSGRTYCVIFWPSDLIRRAYEIFLVAFFIAIPLSIQSWAYICMRRTLGMKLFHQRQSRRQASRDAVPKGQRQEKNANIKKRKRLIKFLFLLVLLFQICYIPRGVFMLLKEFGYFPSSAIFLYLDLAALILYYLKHVINPIILFVTSSNFRAQWRKQELLSCARRNMKPNPMEVRQTANRDLMARAEETGKLYPNGRLSTKKMETLV